MKFIKIFLILSILFSLTFALSESEIQSVMSQKVDKAVSILKDKNLAKDEKPKQIFELFDDYFDYKLMARLSLSNYYKTLDSAQIAKFNKAYENRLKKSFIANLSEYNDVDMKVIKISKLNEKRIVLDTQIIGKEDKYPISFKFYPKSQNEWLIYDVDVLGVSIIQTYRSQFEDLVNRASFEEILQKLEATDFNEQTKK